jgi:hypothetical protein
MTETDISQALAYRLQDAARVSGASVATLYRAAAEGKITIRKLRGRSVILADELRGWLSSLPRMDAA